jgi:LacI family transcriptional regulator
MIITLDGSIFYPYNVVSANGNANKDETMTKRITMHDVSQEAGVSLMTVSRVINGKDDVSEDTRIKVMQVIEKLNFRPSSIARGLVTQRTGTLGVVVPDISNPFFASLVRSAEEEAYAKNYSVFLGNTNEEQDREIAVLQLLEDNQVDGLILCSSRLDDEIISVSLGHFPSVVLVFRDNIGPNVGVVTLDDVRGGQLAVEHLINSGHRNIGLISGPARSLSTKGRLEGYKKALLAAGIPLNQEWIRNCHPTIEAGQERTIELLKSKPEITALFCHNDLIAVGALQACFQLGLSVPHDVAIIGYDDINLAALVTPTLTTIHSPIVEIGARALQMLLEQMSDTSLKPAQIQFQPEIIIRESAP